MDRRKFCLSSAGAVIAGAAAGATGLAAAGQSDAGMPKYSRPNVPIYQFIYDRRYSTGRAFGAAAELAGANAGVVAIGGDITSLWSRDLRQRWSDGGGTIAGMITAQTLFCLEQMARDHWMRVVIRAEHGMSEGPDIAHRLTMAEPMTVQIRAALAADNWPARMPAALAACRGANGTLRTRRVTGSAAGRDWAATDAQLVSFVISRGRGV